MKHLLAGTLAILATPALAQAHDCAALADSPFAMPRDYPLHCVAPAPAKRVLPGPFTAHVDGDVPQAYAVQLSAMPEFVDQGFYRFPLDGSAPQAVNVEAGFANFYALDFNPAATRLYGIQYLPNGSPHRIATINTATGSTSTVSFLTNLFFLAPRDMVTGMTVDPRSGQTYISTVEILTNNPQLTEARLWRLNLHSGTPELVGRLLPEELRVIFIDLAMDCQGRLYGHNISDDSLYRINPGDATVELVGRHGQDANFAQGMDFDNGSGELYAWLHTSGGSSTLGRFDLGSGAFEPIAPAPAGQWEGAIGNTCAPAGINPAALTGAWYAPYTFGQGFTGRYFPESGDVFFAWFTFAVGQPDDGEDDDGDGDTPKPNVHRWYALYGQVEPGRTVDQLDLVITQTTDGTFAQGPGVSGQIVGEARLTMLSCSQGYLDYQFHPGHNEGVSGRVTMQRLLPLGIDCTEPGGHVSQAQATYDPLYSGSWYNPDQAGQGIEIFRIPREEDGTGGLFYGAWYTFAPADSTDTGPQRQRWFTMDGQAINEEDGTIRTAIVYTPGGTFDDEPSVGTAAWGSLHFKSLSCDRLEMRWEFADSDTVREWRNRSGETVLYRLGPCPAGTGD